jgi:CheY-like chemotaxis protein
MLAQSPVRFSGEVKSKWFRPNVALRSWRTPYLDCATVTERKRILIVEDERVLAMIIEDMVSELGYEPVGPATTVESALAMSTEDLDGAILDMNLGGSGPSTPVAEKLRALGVPFVFATGYATKPAGDVAGEAPVLAKPFSIAELSGMLKLLAG